MTAVETTGPAMEPVGQRTHRVLTKVPTGILWLIVVLWTIPSFGLLVTSLRPEADQISGGWWTIVSNPTLTWQNYHDALFSPPGGTLPFSQAFVNSMAIAIPGTLVPIAIAAAAAYAFAWMDFRGRHWLFIGVLAMMAVPLQMSLVPLQQLYSGGAHVSIGSSTFILIPDLNLNNKPIAVWLAHTAFGLPLAIYLLHNYIAGLPRDVFEAARIDGANHFGIFWRIVLPLAKPAIAAFAIFQFLWVWNDYLVALIFLGQNRDASPLTIQLVNLVTSRGQGTELLPAAAFISMVVPLVIFFSLQRYFVRGLLAGSVKG
ncbi:MAG: carbohydrate ABC transporter permease [Acidimicrobiales bacterium]